MTPSAQQPKKKVFWGHIIHIQVECCQWQDFSVKNGSANLFYRFVVISSPTGGLKPPPPKKKFYCLRQVHLAENLPQATHTQNRVKIT